MCIRDSYHAVLNKKGTNVMSLGVQSGGTSKSLVGNPRFQAVSYTHLRAHETVLDIVCRLLLEKKHYTTS